MEENPIRWEHTTVSATFSTNIFNDAMQTARWIGAELSLQVNLNDMEPEERQEFLKDIHARLTELCEEMTELYADRFIQSRQFEQWRK